MTENEPSPLPAEGDAAERERLAKLVEVIAGAITAEDPGSGVSDVQISATHVADLHRAAALLRSSAPAAGGEAVAPCGCRVTRYIQHGDRCAHGTRGDEPLGVLGAPDAIRAAYGKLRALVEEARSGHATPDDSYSAGHYNGCDTDECAWCQRTREAMAEIDSLLGKEEADGRD